MSTSCRDIETLLSPYLDGELDDAAARRVEAHVASCATCRATLEAWAEAGRALAAARPTRSDLEWERLARRVDAAIDAEEEQAAARLAAAAGAEVPATRRASAPTRSRHWWLWSGSGALVAAAVIALFWPWVVPQPGEPPATLSNGREVPPRAGLAERRGEPAREAAATEEGLAVAPKDEGTPVETEEGVVIVGGAAGGKDRVPVEITVDEGRAIDFVMSSEPRVPLDGPKLVRRERPLEDTAGEPAESETVGSGTVPAPPASAPVSTPLDVRRVALADEQQDRPALSPSTLPGVAAGSLPVGRAPTGSVAPLLDESKKAELAAESASPFPARSPAGGATSSEDLAARFARLSETGRGAGAASSRGPEARASAKALRVIPGAHDADEPVAGSVGPAVLPESVLRWANERLDAGATGAAAEGFTLLTGRFPGNDARSHAWLGLVRIRTGDALGSRDETDLLDAATLAEGFLREFPADPQRGEVLAHRARLWTVLAAANPDRYCVLARTAREEWQREATGAEGDMPALNETCED